MTLTCQIILIKPQFRDLVNLCTQKASISAGSQRGWIYNLGTDISRTRNAGYHVTRLLPPQTKKRRQIIYSKCFLTPRDMKISRFPRFAKPTSISNCNFSPLFFSLQNKCLFTTHYFFINDFFTKFLHSKIIK